MSLGAYLTQHIVLMRPSGSNISGSWEETYTTSSAFYGIIETLEVGGWERYDADKKEGYYRYRLYCPVTTIQDTDIVQVDGIEYEVDYVSQWDQIGNHPHTEVTLILRK